MIRKIGPLLQLPKKDGTFYTIHPSKISSISTLTHNPQQCVVQAFSSDFIHTIVLPAKEVEEALEDYYDDRSK